MRYQGCFFMNKILLFSYGTLSNPKYIQLLLKRVPEYTAASLPGYGLFVHPKNGYLFVKPAPNQSVKGQLFEISDQELQLLDRWEEVPLYQRELKMVGTGNGQKVEAFVYTQINTTGLPFQPKYRKSRQQIGQEIDEFLISIEKIH